jgi:DNA-binding transcriptional ArsR family regulator
VLPRISLATSLDAILGPLPRHVDGCCVRDVSGNELLQVLATLANPHRLRVVSALADEPNYVSRLARELGISRALLQVHLRKLEAAGLVRAHIEVSQDGKAMKFYEVTPFAFHLTPEPIMTATRSLSAAGELEAELLRSLVWSFSVSSPLPGTLAPRAA